MTAKTDIDFEIEDWLPEDEEDEEELYYFYDNDENYHQLRIERGDMPNADHNNLVDYLLQILRWLYNFENYAVHREINFYQTSDPNEKPFYPDVFVLKNQIPEHLTSYRLGDGNPAPNVIIEVLSTRTRRSDLYQKPKLYAKWGVKEYFVYDPRPRTRKTKMRRLWGWQNRDGQVVEMVLEKDNSLWSNELESRLIPDGVYLRLYDKDGNLRLTEAETERQKRFELEKQLEFERVEREKLTINMLEEIERLRRLLEQ